MCGCLVGRFADEPTGEDIGSARARRKAQTAVSTIALGIAFAFRLITALIDDRVSRWNIVALALLGVGFGISLAQWLQRDAATDCR